MNLLTTLMITQLSFSQFVVLGKILSADYSSNPSLSADFSSNSSLSADYSSNPSLSADYSSDPSLSADYSSDLGLSTDYSSDPSLSADYPSGSGLGDKETTFPDFTDYEYEDLLDYDIGNFWCILKCKHLLYIIVDLNKESLFH